MNKELLLLETIKLQDGQLKNLSWHQRRMQASSLELWGCSVMWDLAEGIYVPETKIQGLYKVRVIYGPDIFRQQIIPYAPAKVTSLKLIYADHINYQHKYEDRIEIDKLKALRESCDDVLMVKDGLVTDTTYANVVFFDGQHWYTPKYPLLHGTQRQQLLFKGIIREADIRPQDLDDFSVARIINAMIEFDDSPSFPVSGII
jgi:4-amino-4-deoxychorismate lyase